MKPRHCAGRRNQIRRPTDMNGSHKGSTWDAPDIGKKRQDAVKCPSCGWKTSRTEKPGLIGGYGFCERCDGSPRDRILRPVPSLADKRREKAKRQLLE